MRHDYFACKATNLDAVIVSIEEQKEKNIFGHGDLYTILREKKLTRDEWDSLTNDLLASRDWLGRFSEVIRHQHTDFEGRPCILAYTEDSDFGILIDTQGHDYARYTSVIEKDEIPFRRTQRKIEDIITEAALAYGFLAEPDHWRGRMEIHEEGTHYLNFRIDDNRVEDDWANREVTYRLRFSASIASMGGNPSARELLRASEIIARGAKLVDHLNGLELTYTQKYGD